MQSRRFSSNLPLASHSSGLAGRQPSGSNVAVTVSTTYRSHWCCILSAFLCVILCAMTGMAVVVQRYQTDLSSQQQDVASQLIQALAKSVQHWQDNKQSSQVINVSEAIPDRSLVAASTFGSYRGDEVLALLEEWQHQTIEAVRQQEDLKQQKVQLEEQMQQQSDDQHRLEEQLKQQKAQQLRSAAASSNAVAVRKAPSLDKDLQDFCCPYDANFLPLSRALRRAPKLIGLGVHKTGTTFLNSVLRVSSHLNQPAEIKEIKMLSHWPLTPDYFTKYLKYWDLQPEEKAPDYLNFEVTATYLHFSSAACRMKQLLPDAKFVVLLRDPVDRAMSHYNMYLNLVKDGSKRPNPRIRKRFNEEVDREVGMLRGAGCSFDGKGNNPKDKYEDCFKCQYLRAEGTNSTISCRQLGFVVGNTPIDSPCYYGLASEHFVLYGIYAAPIKAWLRIFPKERFMFINDRDLFDDRVKTGNQILEFVGKQPDITARKFRDARVVRNRFKYMFDKDDGDMKLARTKLRRFFARHVRELYDLFDSEGIEFPDFEAWPRGFDVDKVEAGDMSELDAALEQYREEAERAEREEEELRQKRRADRAAALAANNGEGSEGDDEGDQVWEEIDEEGDDGSTVEDQELGEFSAQGNSNDQAGEEEEQEED